MLDGLIKGTKALSNPKNIERLIIEAAKPLEAEIIDLNTGQLELGKLSTGKSITPDYSPAYAEFKGFKTPNLKLEGDFYSGYFVDFRDDFLIIGSNDSKNDKLEEKYSADIHGLTDKSIDELNNLGFVENLIELITDKLLNG